MSAGHPQGVSDGFDNDDTFIRHRSKKPNMLTDPSNPNKLSGKHRFLSFSEGFQNNTVQSSDSSDPSNSYMNNTYICNNDIVIYTHSIISSVYVYTANQMS